MLEEAFTRAIRERRIALELTQAQLAQQVGCAVVTLKRIETGSLRPSRELAERILRMLDIAPDQRAELLRLLHRPRRRRAARNPFKGLYAFAEDDADDFFGRETLVARLLERLSGIARAATGAARLLAVVGPSGSGKSSVVRAGLIPALRQGALPGSDRWRICVALPGMRPCAALDDALMHGRAGLVVFDQFEELWTLCQDESERAAFLSRLLALASEPGGPFVVVTLRADFYDRPLQYHAFGAALRECTEVVLPLTPDEIARAVSGPLERSGVAIEPELVAALVADAGQRPGALPLLQYTLTDLFERRGAAGLTTADYRTIGGIAGAITHRADDLYELLDSADRDATRQIFLRLVQVGEMGEATRRRVYAAELPERSGEITELFARHRLLTLDHDPGGTTVELAHEALIDSWNRLRAWIDEHRDALCTHRRLAHAASEWHAAGADPSFLASGARLAQFEALAAIELNAQERAFLAASIAERERRIAQERAQQEALRENLARSEAQRLAAEANRLLQRGGSAELIALLALHSLELRYTPQGDEALCGAILLDLPVRHFTPQTGRIYCVAYAPDGQTVLTGGQDPVIRAWDVATGVEVRQFIGHTSNLRTLAFSPDGRLIASASDDGAACIWDAASGALLHRLPHGAGVRGVAFTADGRRLLTWGMEPRLRLWDLASGAVIETLDTGRETLRGVALAPDGRSCIYCAGNTILRWTFGEPAPVTLLCDIPGAFAVAYTPDDRMILVEPYAEFIVQRLDIETGSVVCEYRGHTDWIEHFSVTPDGAGVITSSLDSTTRLWDMQTGVEVRRFAGHNNLIWSHACSPDGRFVLTGGTDGTATLWSLDDAPDPPVLRGSPSGLMAAVFMPDGRTAVTIGDDRALRV